jgi:hypothetical protein
MDDPLPEPGQRDRTAATDTPTWVKVFGVITVFVIVLVIVLLLAGSDFLGGHGPERH